MKTSLLRYGVLEAYLNLPDIHPFLKALAKVSGAHKLTDSDTLVKERPRADVSPSASVSLSFSSVCLSVSFCGLFFFIFYFLCLGDGGCGRVFLPEQDEAEAAPAESAGRVGGGPAEGGRV
jgi:hypothetical protein